MYLFLVQKPLPLEPSIILYLSPVGGEGGGLGAEVDGGFWGITWFSRRAEGRGGSVVIDKVHGGGGGEKERKYVREVIRSLEY